jgi:tRNA/rRNA methyltransferase
LAAQQAARARKGKPPRTTFGPPSAAERAAMPLAEATPAICLVNPQMGENIGAAARAMANFGFEELILVRPRDVWPNPKAWHMASGADWPLDNARLVETPGEAVADKTLILATTGTPRNLDKPLIGPREAVARVRAAMTAGERPVVLFGCERSGLDNELIIAADLLVTFPVDGRFPSLNLGASVGLFCYEWASQREADGPPPGWDITPAPPAPRQAFDALFSHLIASLDESRFFWPADRRSSMVDALHVALLRARFPMHEISLLQGAIKSLSEGPRRRARQTDAAEAQAALEGWLAARPDLAGARVTEFRHLDGLGLAVIAIGGAERACVIEVGGPAALKVRLL